ncbi:MULTISPECIES: hypothetical protein [unclassified Bosea (in: a-proteobacteria)]|uniref:hypothetical protein n=1 Tax=unclassified Bosea (in: a-proteobacteria) TaxID=2653178 RepID=UPI000F74C345|nr:MULTISPECIES: hypothetical protein [unclassified Bosea (in: a-proteobacteria)]AZO80195.1 hypothetical protein BLM15_23370 [Bosea sp. Tri-49]RXT22988.1 hypothetical protein B5U98_10160 [Bosea sp. Tri-39]RXT38458.1 hypothetical protein B5U99_09610 [Bosea sp. Tri-54]
MTIGRLALAIGFATLLAAPLRAEQWASSYTAHDYAKCRKDKGNGDPVAVHRCPGKAGITVVWTAGDDSSAVAFGGKALQETISDKAAFFEVGRTIEWRSPKGSRPQAAIVRYATGQSVGKLDGSRLVVYRLAPDGASCILGSVDARKSDANNSARRLADEKSASFRCGQDARTEG